MTAMLRHSSWALASVLFALHFSPFTAFAESTPYVFNQKKSDVVFTLKHVGVITVKGHFESFSGEFDYDPLHIEKGRVILRIQPVSVKTNNAKRDKHLKSEKFFWAERHPEILFVSHEIRKTGAHTFDIHGDLTIRGRTAPAIFETELLSDPQKVTGHEEIQFRTHTFIKRSDYGLGTGTWMNPIMLITGEVLQISLNVTGIPQNKEPAA